MDMFSYGKLCACILFGLEHSTESNRPRVFDREYSTESIRPTYPTAQVMGCATRVASIVCILGPDKLFTKEAIAVLKQKCSNVYHLKDRGENLLFRLCAVSAREPRDPADM